MPTAKPATEFARQQFKKLAAAEAAFYSPTTRPVLLGTYREDAHEALSHLAHGGFITAAGYHKRSAALRSHRPPQGWPL